MSAQFRSWCSVCKMHKLRNSLHCPLASDSTHCWLKYWPETALKQPQNKLSALCFYIMHHWELIMCRNSVFCAVCDAKVCCSLSFEVPEFILISEWCNPSTALIKQSLIFREICMLFPLWFSFVIYMVCVNCWKAHCCVLYFEMWCFKI